MEAASLDEVRHDIDRLMAERGDRVAQAARFKASPSEVEAPARVEQVIGKVGALAAEAGLAPEVAEAACRAMITASIAMEHEVFALQRST